MLNQLTLKQLKQALEETAHPSRILFAEAGSSEHWQRIRIDAKYAAFWEQLEKKAEELIGAPPAPPPFSDFILFGTTGDRTRYQSKRDQLYAGVHTFSLLAMTDHRPEWITGLENTIWSICNESTWVLPAHVGLYHNQYPHQIWDQPKMPRETVDLAAAHIGFTLAEIIHFMGSRLHPWVMERVKAEIDRRIFQVYFHDPVPQNWELKTNNWPAVCASSIGAAAIYLEQDSEKLSGMLWRVMNALRGYLSGFDEQGATPEGPAYWQYGFSHFVYFAELLRERTQGRISLLADEKIEQISLFPQFCMLGGGKVVNFSDSAEQVKWNPGVIHRLQSYAPALQMPEPSSLLLPTSNSWVDISRLMLWSPDQAEPQGEARQDPGQIEERIFEGNQWAISKVTDAKGRIVAFAAKGGYNEEPHNHNDLGHFILHVDGESLLADMGLGVYTRQYFQPEYRYEQLNAGSHGHSVPIVDGCRQGFGRQYFAQMIGHHQTDEEMAFALDLTKAYACPTLECLTRHFVWTHAENETPHLIIRDKVSFSNQPASFQEVFISSVKPEQTAPGQFALNSVILSYEEKDWDAEIENVILDSDAEKGKVFYRIILHHHHPRSDMEISFKFSIS
ncbi:heparinase II/III-family protein [Paenibacillus sp. KQZ6P-2]|uniref:Heparinase II/III-family protein n=1 Tax=Paenibacillus mangrovi TaxID=2931978 RepID=A0A9X1WM45_9BACL|nr:heparinase II/III family protein [Paenibacillus mangrovi]MCJ8011802.1 heparinase II/III-family protein [Paenibacillus mangrovi]